MTDDEVDSYDLVTVEGDFITVDLIVWRRYRQVTKHSLVTERMLDDNPHLAELSRTSPFLPVGTQVRIPLNYALLAGRPTQKRIVKFLEEPQRETFVSLLSK